MSDVPEIRVVDADTWPDMVRLFEGRGGPDYCWCLLWREPWRVRETLDDSGRRATMERRVQAGTPVGLLAYVGGEPVGWCSVAPRDTYLPLGGVSGPDDDGVWSIVCFYVRRTLRRKGIAAAMLDAAVEVARAAGATAVEAYPVDPDSPSYRFMGFVSAFRDAGFEPAGRVGRRRHHMRLALRRS